MSTLLFINYTLIVFNCKIFLYLIARYTYIRFVLCLINLLTLDAFAINLFQYRIALPYFILVRDEKQALCTVSYLLSNNIVKAYGRGSSIDSWRGNFVIDWTENRFWEFDGLFFTACFVQLASSNLYFRTLDGHFGILSIYTQEGGIFS